MNVLAALQPAHDLTLVTIDDPDLQTLNDHFGTSVQTPIPVRRLGTAGRVLTGTYRATSSAGQGLGRLHAAALGRLLRRVAGDYDLIVSTFGEFAFDTPSVQYVHFPMYNRHRLTRRVHERSPVRRGYDLVCDVVSDHLRRKPDEAVLLGNSDWTSTLVEAVHGTPARTLYPPVDTTGFDPLPWEDRDPRLLTVGRIDPQKRTHIPVRIATELHRQGVDLPLHVVGPVGDDEYYQSLREMTANEELIRFEGCVSRDRLVDLLCTSRYGLHGTRNEHFGIVVAEFVAGGAVPFVHDSGGQREIVAGLPELRYESVSDAVERIRAVVEQPALRRRVRERLPNVECRFGTARFRRTLRSIVEDELAAPVTGGADSK